PMTFAATANCILYAGAEPRFADIDPGTLLIEPELVAAAVTARTKALLPVDYAGQPADYDALRAIADSAPGGPPVIIADASHSLSAAVDNGARLTFARRDVRQPGGRDAGGPDGAEPPSGEDPHDRRGRRGPDRPRRPGRGAAAVPEPRARGRDRGA